MFLPYMTFFVLLTYKSNFTAHIKMIVASFHAYPGLKAARPKASTDAGMSSDQNFSSLVVIGKGMLTRERHSLHMKNKTTQNLSQM